jgi:hypothetical protein
VTARTARNDDLNMCAVAQLANVAIALVTATKRTRHVRQLTRRCCGTLPRRPLRRPPSKGEPPMPAARRLFAVPIALLVWGFTLAARPIVDLHKLDAYFALYASDSNVPWRSTTVRLDTYSSAPVQFSVYQVDPADVLTAGSNARPRAISTHNLRPILHFLFRPPGGYQFQPNEVRIPLGRREGFFVVEARRGAVGEQVWINRSRIGLVEKQTPAQLLFYGVDLGSGRALVHLRIQLLLQDHFVTAYTNNAGFVRWDARRFPIFALAQWGSSYAFVSPLPQAPLPETTVGVRTDSAVARAGSVLHVVGFARRRERDVLRPASGMADVTLRDGVHVIARARVTVDRAGAFVADLPIPENAPAGDDAIIAQVGNGVGSESERVDANAGGLMLNVSAACGDRCDASEDVPLLIRSSQPHVEVYVAIVRSPHVYLEYSPSEEPWGSSMWLDKRIETDANGRAEIEIPHPTDGLSSTYGVRVESGSATASTRVVVPTAPFAVRLQLDHLTQAFGEPVVFDVYANDVRNQKPLAGAHIAVSLIHGARRQRRELILDDRGHARGSFASSDFGTNLVTVHLREGNDEAEDAAQVQVLPQASFGVAEENSASVTLQLDRDRYRAGEIVRVDADAAGAGGNALLTLESARGIQVAVVPVERGHAAAVFKAVDSTAEITAGAVFVRDGATSAASVPVEVDAAGRAATANVSLDAPSHSDDATLSLSGVYAGAGTAIIRLSEGEPSGSARFGTAPSLLLPQISLTQSSAPDAVTVHPWVDSTGKHPLVLEFVRRWEPGPDLSLAQSNSRAALWDVERLSGDPQTISLPVHLLALHGRYTLSVMDITDDGRVIVASKVVELP